MRDPLRRRQSSRPPCSPGRCSRHSRCLRPPSESRPELPAAQRGRLGQGIWPGMKLAVVALRTGGRARASTASRHPVGRAPQPIERALQVAIDAGRFAAPPRARRRRTAQDRDLIKILQTGLSAESKERSGGARRASLVVGSRPTSAAGTLVSSIAVWCDSASAFLPGPDRLPRQCPPRDDRRFSARWCSGSVALPGLE